MGKRRLIRYILLSFLSFFIIYLYLIYRSSSSSSPPPPSIRVKEESSVSYKGEIVTPSFTLKAEESASFADGRFSYKRFTMTTSIEKERLVIAGKEAEVTPRGADFLVEMEGDILARTEGGVTLKTAELKYFPESKYLYAEKEVEFSGDGFSGRAGAGSYFVDNGFLNLKKGVRIEVEKEGFPAPVEIVSSACDMRRNEHSIFLYGGVSIKSGDDLIRGRRVTAYLLPDNNSFKRVEIWGDKKEPAVSFVGSSFFKEVFFSGKERKKLSGLAIVVVFDRSGKNPELLQVLNPAILTFYSPDYGNREIKAERIEFTFGEEGNLREVNGYNGVKIVLSPKGGEHTEVTCRNIKGKPDESGEVNEFRLLGGAEIERGEIKGRGDEGRYILRKNRVVLIKNSTVKKGDEFVSAEETDLSGDSGDITASSRVVSRFSSSGEFFPGSSEKGKAVVNADKLYYDQLSDCLHYKGSVRALYDAGILFANELYIDRAAATLTASGDVRLRFDQKKEERGNRDERLPEGPITARGERLTYYRDEGKLILIGDVTLSQGELKVEAERLTLFQDEVKGGWKRGVASGEVRIFYLRDKAYGEEGEYYFLSKIAILTGSPAKLSRYGEGELEGRSLTFLISGDKMSAVSREYDRVKALYKEKH
jgi:lipopolysaccharide transport protein LptA